MYCFNCGKQIPDDSVFCPECGTRVDAPLNTEARDETPTTILNKPSEEVFPTPEEASTQNSSFENSTTQQSSYSTNIPAPQDAKQPKKSAARIVIPVVALVIIVAAVVVAGTLTNWFGIAGGSVQVKGSVNDYTWEELSTISDEIAAAPSQEEAINIAKRYHLCNDDGTLDGSQRKDIQLKTGVSTSVQIIGFNHDDASDGSGKAGITFAFTNMVDFRPMSTRSSNEGGWQYSDLRAYLNSDFIKLLPDDLRDYIIEVDKSTNNKGVAYDAASKSFTTSYITATPDKIWLLSYTEIVGDVGGDIAEHDSEGMTELLNNEGNQYQLYSNLSITQNNTPSELMSLNVAEGAPNASSATDTSLRWSRTSNPVDTRFAYTIHNTNGNCNESHTISNVYGVAPCFCI